MLRSAAKKTRLIPAVMVLSLCACAHAPPPPAPKPALPAPPSPPPPALEPRTQIIRDPELERQVRVLELQLMERDARIESLEARLEQALREVVGTMGKLRSLATRAEAASAMAETDVALRSTGTSDADSPESKQARRLMQQSSAEFKRNNFGGALYLANQAKAAARPRGLPGRLGNMRPGEVAFAGPVKLSARTRANVRSGPSLDFAVSFTADSGVALSGLSYLGEWIRVTNDAGNEGWIFGSLVGRREE